MKTKKLATKKFTEAQRINLEFDIYHKSLRKFFIAKWK